MSGEFGGSGGDNRGGNSGGISFDKVSVRFPGAPGDGTIVDEVSLTVGAGDFVSLIGPSGCGKTTLLKLAAGMLAPSAGEVRLDGAPVRGPGPERGVVFQDYGVFPWLSVEQNIAFGLSLAANARRIPAREHAAIVERYLALTGLADFRHALPRTLSGGMKQRVALARAYAVQPRFLLMDEPFGALDAQTRLAMQDLLLELQQGERKGVLLITHSVEEALYLSTRIVVITARPARIREVIEVPFGWPRSEALLHTPEFVALHARLRALVMAEYAAQQRQLLPA